MRYMIKHYIYIYIGIQKERGRSDPSMTSTRHA
jgi:hypothetical protein